MRDWTKPYTGKVIVFRFCGGTRDGQTVRSDQPQEGINYARAFWALTRMGSGGHRFEAHLTDGSGRSERYKVLSKSETDSEILVTCEHVR
jgi:hypothetical protein